MDERGKPGGHRARIVIFVSIVDGSSGGVLPCDADMAQPLEISDNLIQPRFGVGGFVQTSDDGFDKFARQPCDALVFSLDAWTGFQRWCTAWAFGLGAASRRPTPLRVSPGLPPGSPTRQSGTVPDRPTGRQCPPRRAVEPVRSSLTALVARAQISVIRNEFQGKPVEVRR